MTTVLRYNGDEEGVPFVMGVPARNLTDDDMALLVGGRWGNDKGTVRRRLAKVEVDGRSVYSEVSQSKAKPSEAKPSTDTAPSADETEE